MSLISRYVVLCYRKRFCDISFSLKIAFNQIYIYIYILENSMTILIFKILTMCEMWRVKKNNMLVLNNSLQYFVIIRFVTRSCV